MLTDLHSGYELNRRMSAPLAEELDIQTSSEAGTLRLTFRGDLNLENTPPVWNRLRDAVRESDDDTVLDLGGLRSCDGVGIGLITDLKSVAQQRNAGFQYENASDEIGKLLDMASTSGEPSAASAKPAGFVTQIGGHTSQTLATIRDLVAFIGSLTVAVPRTLRTLNASRLGEILHLASRVGADAVPVVSLLGALVGYILAVQAANALQNVGGVSMVPMVVGFSVLREFGPLIAAIILAGRSGSAFAAELGTMKVTEELDAYQTLTLDPMVVLVAPRVLVTTLLTPLLTVFCIVLAILGGVIPMLLQRYTLNGYLAAVIEAVAIPDLIQAIVKGTVFGLIVGVLGCFHGLRTGKGADAVGVSATRAVVAGIVAVLIADSILSSLFYSLNL